MLQASVAAALLSAATAHAATIDFDAASVSNLLHANNTLLGLADVYYGTSYTEDGFVLTSSLGHSSLHALFVADDDNTLIRPAADSYAMGSTARATTTLTTANNSAFSITSIDLSKQVLLGGSVTFYGVKADNSATVQQTFNYNGSWNTYTFDSTFTGLSSLSWKQGAVLAGKVQWDNINVSAVPEPETYAMLLAGLGLIGLARRRKQA
ncbi:PEP-CTERM protein-sorting domain-containing protein/MYXO-CTERM domain-containing protein [Duganella sp. CF402]|nr:putative secreted protein with PEP-CTERM sorting signal/MYXO-CTERM domain-containing protein [Duganella sp. BK701]SEK70908.1 PEP-CTERM protein-sorting domain-containing protein/MYXO-CTERM domain-containing protein [Duganella sp. CF402]